MFMGEVMIEERHLLTLDDYPTPEMIGADTWGVAEREAERIFSRCQATLVSEERRKKVIDYVKGLLRFVGCEVYPYGSVPLKTYLPDGDIDLTAFGVASGEDTLANNIVSLLEAEERNLHAEFVVKDVQLVRAEVKLVKCIVQNIVVDISLNQLGGLSTLCFLEEVDRVIGKDHLFKKSIILIKAWCYYESRILGAHHGLISTYALETLVLYIFHVFHSTLDGPLAVLYKFLDYFSKFDWETYCVSLNGPVRISALPDRLAEMPQNGTHDLLLGNDYLRYCSERFSVPLREVEMNSRAFPPKHLNIVDPLKDNNNLGRSVSKGNFYRIRSAFTFGARKLGRILMCPVDDIARELQMFFSSTLDRHGSGQRPDIEDSPPRSTLSGYARLEPEDGRIYNGNLRSSVGFPALPEYENLDEHMIFLGNRVAGDAKDLATSSLEGLKISNERTKISPPRDKEIVRPARMPPHAPHLYFSREWLAYGKTHDGDVDENQSENFENDEVVASRGIPELNCADLSGDYESHVLSLQHFRRFYDRINGYSSSVRAVAVMPPPPSSPASFEGINLWDPLRYPFQQFKRIGFSHGNMNGVIHNPVFYTKSQMPTLPVAFGTEEMPRHRGIGTYFPHLNGPPRGVRPSIPNGRNHGQAARSHRTNSRACAYADANMHDRTNIEEQLSQSYFPVDQSLGMDIHQSYSPRRKLNPNANGFIPHPETTVAESGTVEHHMRSSRPLVPVSSRHPKSPASLRPQMPGHGSPAPTLQRPKSIPGPDRLPAKKLYHLKDEDDFPPLSF